MPTGASGCPLPRDIQIFETVAWVRCPQGVLLVHEALRACFLFKSGQLPQLVSVACGAALLCSGSGGGIALLRGERVRWLSVSKKLRDMSWLKLLRMVFTLSRAARPVDATEATEQPSRKVPKLRELTIETGPVPPIPKRLPPNADVEVAIYKVSDDAASVWDEVKSNDTPLYQVQFRHDAARSCVVHLLSLIHI